MIDPTEEDIPTDEEHRLETRAMIVRAVETTEPDLTAIRIEGEATTFQQSWLGDFYDLWDDENQQVLFHNRADEDLVADVGDYILMGADGDVEVVTATDFFTDYYAV